MDKHIFNFLKSLCISPNLQGYSYIVSAIKICLECPAMPSMTELYEAVAVAHSTTPNRAERSIRHAIEHGFKLAPQEAICQFMSPHSYQVKPTNSAFLGAAVEWLRMELNDEKGWNQ